MALPETPSVVEVPAVSVVPPVTESVLDKAAAPVKVDAPVTESVPSVLMLSPMVLAAKATGTARTATEAPNPILPKKPTSTK